MEKWIHTDPDCCQYIRQMNAGKTQFEGYQIAAENEDETSFAVVHAFVDLEDYDLKSQDFYQDYLMPYCYDSLGHVFRIYGDDFERVLAELIMETEVYEQLKVWHGTYEACEQYISLAIKLDALAPGQSMV